MRVVSVLVLLLWSPLSQAYEPPRAEAIPLDEIWAYRMPGTKDVREFEPEIFSPEQRNKLTVEGYKQLSKASPTMQLVRHLIYRKPVGNDGIGSSFAVEGTGEEALQIAHSVLVLGKPPQGEFRGGKPLSIVFYTGLSSYYVRLEQVSRAEGRIHIKYRVIAHLTRDKWPNLAIIPIGSPTEERIEVVILPPIVDESFAALGHGSPDMSGFAERLVSRSFSFEVLPEGEVAR